MAFVSHLRQLTGDKFTGCNYLLIVSNLRTSYSLKCR